MTELPLERSGACERPADVGLGQPVEATGATRRGQVPRRSAGRGSTDWEFLPQVRDPGSSLAQTCTRVPAPAHSAVLLRERFSAAQLSRLR